MNEGAVETQLVARTESVTALTSHESGVMALAMMSEEEFSRRLTAMKKGQERVRIIQRELMIGPTQENPEGEDYGVIPGTKKPTLLKPGAEKICNVYGLVPTFEEIWIEGDGQTRPHLRVRMKCFLHRGDATGPVVGEGVGAANSWEKKHRYRGGQRSCPSCGCEGTIRRSRFPDCNTGDKGWYCHDKAGGCGEQFAMDDPRIAEQQVGIVDNPDPFEVENTLLKMAKKRAHVDATLTATATSGLFTQDVEDIPGEQGGSGATKPPAPQPRQAAPAPRTAAPPQEREPGSDDEWPDRSEEAYAAHGVERPAPEPPRHARQAPPAKGAKPPCPHCGKPAMASKFPKPGQSHYCYDCKHPFEPGNE